METPAIEHDPPSVPASPSPKRFKSVVASPAPAPEAMSTAATHLPPMNLEPPPPALQIKLLSATARAPTRGNGRVAPRSGLAAKHSIDVGAGVIDADYRGPLKVLLFNLGETDFAINEGDRIAQLIIERIYTPEVVVVEQLPESVRGAGGFGSTGGFANMIPPVNPSANGGSPINGH
ncbi:unnamed protein product [Aureobasidium uvarum]|uniref:Deoxyuridine 5'-triphosphate nucleotidohydrolase n=1 Tax=Aureobasidium uvarum TaxID=2773716 RepID=A0A9N8PWB4_9PEZI|nr:unnamed protein product [Aureobasidium uvarum]